MSASVQPSPEPIGGYTGTPGTYGYMQARIADEVLGGASTTQIQGAIQDAITEYQDERFYFNECRFQQQPLTDTSGQVSTDSSGQPILGASILTTIPKQEFYPLVVGTDGANKTLAQMSKFDRLVILAFANRYPLDWTTPQWMDDQSVGPAWYALPEYWTLDAGQIRFYPIPDQEYPVYVTGTRQFDLLVNAGDSNPWTLDAEVLIRRRAKVILFRSLLRNEEMARAEEVEEQKALKPLLRRTMTRGGPPRIRPTTF